MEAEWIFNGPCTTCKITNERPCITSLLICINLNFHQLCHWTSVTVLHVVKITNSQLTTSDFRSVRCCIHSVWMTLYVWHKVTPNLPRSTAVLVYFPSVFCLYKLFLLACRKLFLLFSVCASVVFLNVKHESVMPRGGLESLPCL